jgi:hypothetical protein
MPSVSQVSCPNVVLFLLEVNPMFQIERFDSCQICRREGGSAVKMVPLPGGKFCCSDCAGLPALRIASGRDFCSVCLKVVSRGDEIVWTAAGDLACRQCAASKEATLPCLGEADRQELQELLDRVQRLAALPTPHSITAASELDRLKRALAHKFGQLSPVVKLLERYGKVNDEAPATGSQKPETTAVSAVKVCQILDEKPRKYVEKMRMKSPQAYFHWSRDEEEQLLSFLARKMAVLDIARFHGRSRGAINSRIRRLTARTSKRQEREPE